MKEQRDSYTYEENPRQGVRLPTHLHRQAYPRAKNGFAWWVQYFVKGIRFRESSNSRSREEAEASLRQRLEAAAQGKPIGPKAGKVTFEDLATILLDDYRAKGRRSVGRVEDTVRHLRRFFDATYASQISGDFIARYVRSRQEGAAPATINRELGALKARLSARAIGRQGSLLAGDFYAIRGQSASRFPRS